MTLDKAKIALRNGALFGDVYIEFIKQPASIVATSWQGLIDDVEELRRFFCYELFLQERCKVVSASLVVNGTHPAPKPIIRNKHLVAKEMGYEGTPCVDCGGMKVKRTGVCLVCEECHTSSGGCS